MIFPRKKLILPCHKNGYLQSASDARQWRDRFKRNPLAKVADMFIPKPLRMSPGYPCCCGTSCSACGTTVTSDGTVTWFEHEVDEETGEITRVDKSGDCVTYYVDSVSGGGAESGTGTEEDPWTNFNTVFSDSCIYAICTTGGCPKVKVLVKGTIDYAISGGGSSKNYGGNLILEPWDAESVTSSKKISSVYGCIFKLINVNTNDAGYYLCKYCSFDECSVTIVATGSGLIWGYWGYFECEYSAFDKCISDITNTQTEGIAHAYYGCNYSSFRDCDGDAEGYNGGGMAGGFAAGYSACENSFFYICDAIADCNAPTNLKANSVGFNGNDNSIFNTCDATASVYSPTGCMNACGFYNNSSSSFSNCTTSDRVCSDACANCGTYTCDV